MIPSVIQKVVTHAHFLCRVNSTWRCLGAGHSAEAAGSVNKLRIDRRYSVNCRSLRTVPEPQLRPAAGDAAARRA
jgi:hypothetical protein